MSNFKQFFGGIPTEMDVRTLIEQFGVPKAGTSITYDEVASAINQKIKSHRYGTVTNAWRRKLFREHNVIFRAREGKFTVMDPGQRVFHGGERLRRGAREFRKANVIVTSTDRAKLTDEEKAQADHIQLTTATAIQACRIQARLKTPVQLPEAVS